MNVRRDLFYLLAALVLMTSCTFSSGDGYEQYPDILQNNTSSEILNIKLNYADNASASLQQMIKNEVIKSIYNVSSYRSLSNFTMKAFIISDGMQTQSPLYYNLNSSCDVDLFNSSFIIQSIMTSNIPAEDNKQFINNAEIYTKYINNKYYMEMNAPEMTLISENNGSFKMFIIDDIVYANHNNSWFRYYDPDVIASLGGKDAGMLINKTNILNLTESQIKGIEECDGKKCFKIEISPATSMEGLIKRPDITFKDQILSFLASDVRMTFNETIWVSTDNYLLNKDIIEINIYMPKENKTYDTYIKLYSITQYYDFNKQIEPTGEIILPKDAENAKWTMALEGETTSL